MILSRASLFTVSISILTFALFLVTGSRAMPEPDGTEIHYVRSDTVWTAAASPHILIGTLVIEEGVNLTIEAGAEVQCALDAMLIIYGGLHCVGIPPDSLILFEPLITSNRWGGIGIIAAADTVRIQHATFYRTKDIPYGSYPLEGIVSVYDSNIIVTDCLFRDDYYGFGVVLRHSGGLVARNTFVEIRGQVVSGTHSTTDIIDNVFEYSNQDAIDFGENPEPVTIAGNIINGNGDDGIDLDYFTGTVARNVIRNCADKGISVSQTSNVRLENNIIYDSFTGLGITAGSTAEVWNNTIYDCIHGILAWELHSGWGGVTVTGANMLLWENTISLSIDAVSTVTLTYSDVEGDTVYAGLGNFSADPLFLDPDNGDLHLSAGSPCIDAGLGDGMPEFDFEGDPRVDDRSVPDQGAGTITYVDIGADEYTSATTAIGPEAAPAVATRLLAVSPNPLRVGATLHVDAPVAGRGSLRLYDVEGRMRRHWTSVALPGAIVWDGRDARGRRVAAGVYFFEFRPADAAERVAWSTRITIMR